MDGGIYITPTSSLFKFGILCLRASPSWGKDKVRVSHKKPKSKIWERGEEQNLLLQWRCSHLHLRHNGKRIARMFAEKVAVSIHEPRQTRTANRSAEEEQGRYIRMFFLHEDCKLLCYRGDQWNYLSESDWTGLLHIDEHEYLQKRR